MNCAHNFLDVMRKQSSKNEIKSFHISNDKIKENIAQLVIDQKILPSEGYWFTQEDVALASCLSFLRKRIQIAVWHQGPLKCLVNTVGKPIL